MVKIKGILFDLGNTVLDFGEVDTLELFEQGGRLAYGFLKDLGQPAPPFKTFYRRQLRAVRWAYFKSRLIGREFNSLDVLRRLSRSMGQSLNDGQMVELAWLWYQPLSEQASVEPGLGEVLDGLVSGGIRLAVISNTFVPGAVLDRHLQKLDLLRRFPDRIYSCDCGYRKPDERIFRLALERLGLAPEEAMLVGDTLQADVAGANRAGIVSVLKDPSGTRRSRRIVPAHRIGSLRQLPEVVARYNGGPGAPVTAPGSRRTGE